jgi:hypothetical protein
LEELTLALIPHCGGDVDKALAQARKLKDATSQRFQEEKEEKEILEKELRLLRDEVYKLKNALSDSHNYGIAAAVRIAVVKHVGEHPDNKRRKAAVNAVLEVDGITEVIHDAMGKFLEKLFIQKEKE